jgi:phage shock protein E
MTAVCTFVGVSPVLARSFTVQSLLCRRSGVLSRGTRSLATHAEMSTELISPGEANTRKGNGSWVHIDVRSEDEYVQGHPSTTSNIPFLRFGALGVPKRNPDFVETIAAKFDKSQPIILSCQSGKRSAMAADVLQQSGFEKLADIEGGFAAWSMDPSLPVEK